VKKTPGERLTPTEQGGGRKKVEGGTKSCRVAGPSRGADFAQKKEEDRLGGGSFIAHAEDMERRGVKLG